MPAWSWACARRRGFTVVEVMFSLTLLAVLTKVLLVNVGGANAQAYQSAMTSDVRDLALAEVQFQTVHGDVAIGRLDDAHGILRGTSSGESLAFRPSPGIRLTVSPEGDRGFTIVATHAGAPGIACGAVVAPGVSLTTHCE